MVNMNKKMITQPPRFIAWASITAAGLSIGMKKCMQAAGINKLTRAGTNREKKSAKGTTPFCHTNSVVMSPKGLNDPPALEAITTLMQDKVTKRGLSLPMASITEPINKAVVKLLQPEEIKKDCKPVIQNNCR